MGAPRPAPGRRAGRHDAGLHCSTTAGPTPMPRCATNSTSPMPASPEPSSRAMPRSATPTPPTVATCCPPFGPRCTGSAGAAETAPHREAGSAVCQVFDGSGVVTIGDQAWTVGRGDMFVVPSWQPLSIRSDASTTDSDSGALDLFRFSDSPLLEALGLDRSTTERAGRCRMRLATVRAAGRKQPARSGSDDDAAGRPRRQRHRRRSSLEPDWAAGLLPRSNRVGRRRRAPTSHRSSRIRARSSASA